jgi:maleylpyruvate isomerase
MAASAAGIVPIIDMAHAVACYQAVMETLRGLDDAAARGPSLLPGWTRAHVVGHLARHADGHRRMLEGALRGDIAQQYPGGAEGRAHEIHLAASQPADRLVEDLRRSSEALFAIWEDFPGELWDQPTQSLVAGVRPARELVRARWWELEYHHVDLDLGFGGDRWPRAFVHAALTRVITGAPGRRRAGGGGRTRWLVVSDDGSGSWLVEDDGTRATVTTAEPAEPADVALTGPSWALLLWLMGRRRVEDLPIAVVGPADVADDLPDRVPYP